MTLPRTVAEVLSQHTPLEVESIDRMYLNAYVPGLQHDGGVAAFFRSHRGQPFASSALMAPISQAFVAAIEAFVAKHGVPLIVFAKGQRNLLDRGGTCEAIAASPRFPLIVPCPPRRFWTAEDEFRDR